MVLPTPYEVETQRFVNALYNIQLGSETMSQVEDTIAVLGMDGTFNYYFNYINGSQTTGQVTETLLANYGIISGQYGMTDPLVDFVRDYINDILVATPAANRGAVINDLNAAWASLAGDATFGAAATAWNAEISTAVAYDGTDDLIAGTEIPDNTFFYLTAGQDVVPGTAGDDSFYADVVQNSLGAQVNSLGTGDSLTGGAGFDSLVAQVTEGVFSGGGNMAIQPRTMSVDDIKLEALFSNIGLEALDLNLGSLIHGAIDIADNLLDTLPPGSDAYLDIVDAIELVNDTSVYYSAKSSTGLDKISSFDSDADLTVMDLNTKDDDGTVRFTSAMTVGMAYTGNADHVWNEADFRVYFDEDYLLSGKTTSESEAKYWLLDEIAWDVIEGNIAPPADGTYDGIAAGEYLWRIDRMGLVFTLDPKDGRPSHDFAIEIGVYTDNDYTDAETWVEYKNLINLEIAAMIADGSEPEFAWLSSINAVVKSGGDYNRDTFTDSDDMATIPAIVLVDDDGGAFSNLGFIRDQGATGYFDVFGDISNTPSEDTSLLISVQVDLEKVGRGGDGGELVIGGMNKDADNEWGDGSSLKPAGVEQFDVTVYGDDSLPNSLAGMKSTNNALQVINIVSEAGVTSADAASLQIGNSNTVQGLAFAPEFVWGFDVAGDTNDGDIFPIIPAELNILVANYEDSLKDIQIIDAQTFQGELTIYAGITDEAIAKYLDLVDTTPTPNADDVMFAYLGGVNDDNFNVQIDSDVVAQEDFQLDIVTGTGNDTVVAAIMNGWPEHGGLAQTPLDEEHNWYWNQIENAEVKDIDGDGYLETINNLRIDTGANDDVVWIPGSGNWNVNLGTGDDVIYTDNTGGMSIIHAANEYSPFSAWMFNTMDDTQFNNQINEAQGGDLNTWWMYRAQLTVEFMGHEVTVDLANYNNGKITDADLNQAIIAAINGAPTQDGNCLPGLSAVLYAHQTAGYSLAVESLIDGDVPAPTISITLPTSLTSSEIVTLAASYGVAANLAAVLNAMDDSTNYIAEVAWDGVFEGDLTNEQIIGVESRHNSDNIIEGDLGDDVFVLGTFAAESSNDTLVYEGWGNGFDCVYNFQSGVTDFNMEIHNTAIVTSHTDGANEVVGAAGTAIAETFTLEVTAGTGNNNVAGTITFNGGTVTIPLDATLAQVVAAFITPTVAYTNYTVTAGPTLSTLIFTEKAPLGGVDIADSTHQVDDFIVSDPTLSGVLVGEVDGVDGRTDGFVAAMSATFETFTVDFGDSDHDVTYTFDGEEIPVLNLETGVNIAQAVAFGDYANWTAALVAPGSTSVVFTAKVAGAVDDATYMGAAVGNGDFYADFIGANIPHDMPDTFYLPDNYDMLDFSSYNVDAVYVNGTLFKGVASKANGTYVWLDEMNQDTNGGDNVVDVDENEPIVNLGEYEMTVRQFGTNGTFEGDNDVQVGLIGVLDFGFSQDFDPAQSVQFII